MTLEASLPDFKSTYEFDSVNKVLKASWSETEQISLISMDRNSHVVKTADLFTSTGEAGRTKAAFTGTFTGDVNDDIIVMYPALTGFNGDASQPECVDPIVSSSKYWITIGSQYAHMIIDEIHQTENDSLDGFFDFMRGKATIDGTTMHASLNKLVRLFRFEIDCSELVADGFSVVNNMSITSTGYNIVPTTGEVKWVYAESTDHIWPLGSNKYQTVYLGNRLPGLKTYAGISIPASNKIVVYLPDFGTSDIAVGDFTVRVRPTKSGVESYSFTKTLSNPIKCAPGQEYNIKVKVNRE